MAHVAGTEGLVNGFRVPDVGQAARRQAIPDEDEEATERGRLPDADVEDLIDGRRPRRGDAREQVGLDHVLDMAEVPAGLAVPEDDARVAARERGDPPGDHRRVGAPRVLARAEDVEVAQADGLDAVRAREDLGVQLVDALAERIRGERAPDLVLDLGTPRGIAVHRARGGVDEAGRARIASGDDQVEKSVDVDLVGGERVFE